MNWNIKISYKATNKTKTQTFLNIKRTRKQKKKQTNKKAREDCTVKDLTFIYFTRENIKYNDRPQKKSLTYQ